MNISRQTLFGKLGVELYRGIESATSFCKLRGNPFVELVHWLHQLLRQPDGDLQRIVRHADIDRDALERDLARALAALPAGASSISDFSWHIETAIERSWVLATLGHGDRRVRGAWLIAALVRVHKYGNKGPCPYRSGNNAHVHKEDPAGNQLNDRGIVSLDPNETHIGIRNPADLPAVRGRPHGS